MLRRLRGGDGAGDRWIVVGLGNPGARYARNRHNAGVMVLDELLERNGSSLKRHKSGCLVAEANVGSGRAVLARPASFMNDSGRPVAELARWYRVPPERLVVVHDELDIPFGRVRVKAGGGTAGHNGLRSIAQHLGMKEFVRIRVGISRPRGGSDATGYVLSDFSPAERRELPVVIGLAADAAERVLEKGAEAAMNEFNAEPSR